ncbi:MAG: hypothetical protein M3464_03445 [Chloroflexota bacterium]|nr:hypothetical protein [Chloroflexota bacterium]
MEARQRAVAAPVEDDRVALEERPRRPSRPAATRPVERTRPTAVRRGLTRAQEFAYIRSDLRRLVFTAGPLLLLMITLLVVIDR